MINLMELTPWTLVNEVALTTKQVIANMILGISISNIFLSGLALERRSLNLVRKTEQEYDLELENMVKTIDI